MIIGLTGGIGSGKSTVLQYFKQLGVRVLDTDEIARALLMPKEPAFNAVVQHFGQNILTDDGHINRSLLRSLIFESITERHWLEGLLHPLIKTAVLKFSAQKKAPYCMVEIPLLFEAKFEDTVDRILVVDCTVEAQIKHLQIRETMSNELVTKIMAHQADRHTRLEKAHEVIENNEDLEALHQKVRALHQHYINLSDSN